MSKRYLFKYIIYTFSSTKLNKNAAALLAPHTLDFPILHKSANSPFIISLCSSVTGILQNGSYNSYPISINYFDNSSLLLNNPPVFSPKAAAHAPVNVDISNIDYGSYYYYVQLKQSAKTNLPSASVLFISTVNPE